MPVITTQDGNVYAIPNQDLEKYKVSPENAPATKPRSARDEDDIELQSAAPGMSPYQWYGGD